MSEKLIHHHALEAVCQRIVLNNNEITVDDMALLYLIFRGTLKKALEILDSNIIERLTLKTSGRQYFCINERTGIFTLYNKVIYCECSEYKSKITKDQNNCICRHILACQLGSAMNKIKETSVDKYLFNFGEDCELNVEMNPG